MYPNHILTAHEKFIISQNFIPLNSMPVVRIEYELTETNQLSNINFKTSHNNILVNYCLIVFNSTLFIDLSYFIYKIKFYIF